MKLIFANPKYWPALWQDTVGQEDKAKATLGLDTLAKKQDFWYTTAVFCAAVGVAGAYFTWGASLLLLLVTWRKWDLIKTKKETPNVAVGTPVQTMLPGPGAETVAAEGARAESGEPTIQAGATTAFGLFASGEVPAGSPAIQGGGLGMTDVETVASSPTVGQKTIKEKLQWLKQNVMIQFRTRRWLPYFLVGGVVAAAVIGGVAHQKPQQAQIVAPKQLCECPLKVEPPVQGKAKAKAAKGVK